VTIAAAKFWLLDQPNLFAKPMPAVPTRAQVCSVQMSFQGLTVNLPDMGGGPIGWFEAALCCLTAKDRQVVYAAKHLAGDTHALIFVTNGMPLYNEPNQPYQAYQCPDYSTDHAALEALTEEVIREGFLPAVFMREDEGESTTLIQIAVNVLRTAAAGDLTQYAIFVPGFDGVFYGWNPPDITNWDVIARANGARYLGIEHNTGHIPVGNGPADYAPGGAMTGYDTILSEFDPWGQPGFPALAGDGTWQIAARLLGSEYVRPQDQTPGDDPHPPAYLATGSDRGPYFAVAFETWTYWFVRDRVSVAAVEQTKIYQYKLGYKAVC
jgi:hypothetical protein